MHDLLQNVKEGGVLRVKILIVLVILLVNLS